MSEPAVPTSLAEGLWWLPGPAANAYVVADDDGLTIVDPGLPGEQDAVLDAVTALGRRADEVLRVVLTHWHADHSGAAAALAARTGATLHAGRADAAALRGEVVPPPPDLTEDERPMYEAIAGANPGTMAAPPLPAVRDLADGERLGGSVVLHLGGHTDGSVALHLPDRAAVLTGDVAMLADGGVGLGLFHVDRDRARAALDVVTDLRPSVVGFGHGPPLS